MSEAVMVGGVRLAHRVSGDPTAPPVLLLHALSGPGQAGMPIASRPSGSWPAGSATSSTVADRSAATQAVARPAADSAARTACTAAPARACVHVSAPAGTVGTTTSAAPTG